jgi:hypothetical protein
MQNEILLKTVSERLRRCKGSVLDINSAHLIKARSKNDWNVMAGLA